jgi:lysyl-tRNA synthetase class 2
MSTEQPDQDLPEQTRVRLEKVARLRELGLDPYTPRAHRTHEIAELAALVPPMEGATDSADGGTTPPSVPSEGEAGSR